MNKKTVIANKKGSIYSKPVVLTAGKDTFIVYIEDGRVVLHLHKNKTNISDNKDYDVVNSERYAYEPAIFRVKNVLYIGFCKRSGNEHTIYVTAYGYQGNSVILDTFEMDKFIGENIEDLRIVVDNDSNIFITYTGWMADGGVHQHTVSRYDDLIEKRISTKREKHGDIAVDDNFLYKVSQLKQGKKGYIIALQKKINKVNGKWGAIQEVAFEDGLVQRPRCSLTDGILHVIFHIGKDPKRKIYYKYSKDGFREAFEVSQINKPAAYGSIDISAITENDVFVSMKKGREIIYNEMIEGRWTGARQLLRMQPDTQACFLDQNKFSVVFPNKNEEIILIQDGDLSKKEPVQPEPTQPIPNTIPEPEIKEPVNTDEKLKENVIPKMKVEKHVKEKVFRFNFKKPFFHIKFDLIWQRYKSQIILFGLGLLLGILMF
jgi:hypothetical protein